MKVGYLYATILFLLVANAHGQIANSTYSFLNIPSNAKSTGLAGAAIALDGDLSQVGDNPAYLDSGKENISFNYNNYAAGINAGALYFNPQKKLSNTAFLLQYFNYGSFLMTDIAGNVEGEFTPGEMAFTVFNKLPELKGIEFGIGSKLVYSSFDIYQSLGIGIDFGAFKELKDDNGNIGLVVKNLGYQLVGIGSTRSWLPLDVQFGYSRKLAKAPFVLNVLAHNLQTWDLTYDDGSQVVIDPITGEETRNIFTIDNFLRHFAGGIQFKPSESFQLRLGYNHNIKRSMNLASRSGFTGFSLGMGLNFNKFTFEYGVAGYHLAGTSHVITLNTKI